MRTELPKFWQIKALNEAEAKIIQPYANKISQSGDGYEWSERDCAVFFLCIKDGIYYGGNKLKYFNVEVITFEEFKVLVLQNQLEPNYEVY